MFFTFLLFTPPLPPAARALLFIVGVQPSLSLVNSAVVGLFYTRQLFSLYRFHLHKFATFSYGRSQRCRTYVLALTMRAGDKGILTLSQSIGWSFHDVVWD